MNDKHDRRSQRTRQLISDAFVELLLEKGYETISIREVIARANVPGKLATVFQFCAVLSAIALPNMLNVLLAVAAIAGGLAGVAYWMRALGQQNKARKE